MDDNNATIRAELKRDEHDVANYIGKYFRPIANNAEEICHFSTHSTSCSPFSLSILFSNVKSYMPDRSGCCFCPFAKKPRL
jgi:hypothetical protein